MDHPLVSIIEEQIRRAELEGKFKDLPGSGKPLKFLSKDSGDAVLNKMAKESGYVPPVLLLKQQIKDVRQDLQGASGDERLAKMARLSDLELRYALAVEALNR